MTDWWSILGGGAIILFLIFIVCLPLFVQLYWELTLQQF